MSERQAASHLLNNLKRHNMSNNTSTSFTTGPGLPSLLTVLFVALKLMGYIAWSWWWVFSPLWIPLAIVLAFIIVVGVVAVFSFLIAAITHKI